MVSRQPGPQWAAKQDILQRPGPGRPGFLRYTDGMTEHKRITSAGTSRRRFLQGAGGAAGLAWLGGGLGGAMPFILQTAKAAEQARLHGEALLALSTTQARDVEAFAMRLMPTTDTPGAREVGVIWFIDRAMDGWMAGARPGLEAGLGQLSEAAAASGGEGSAFHQLDAAAQDRIITDLQEGGFFQLMHFLTIAGMFAMPSYGGNRRQAGWQLLGFEDQHLWQPPFGHYDALAMNGEGGESDAGDTRASMVSDDETETGA